MGFEARSARTSTTGSSQSRSARTSTTGLSLSRSARLLDYWAVVYRRTWRGSVVSSFVVPLLYILSLGVLLGGFINGNPAKLEGASSYLDFVAPGMLAAQVMTTVFGELTYPLMAMIKWNKVFDAMIATPLSIPDIVLAHLGFMVFRVATVAAVFLVVMAPFGVFASPAGVVAAFFVQILVGLAFATPVYALSAGLRNENGYALVFRLGMIPMFLFSGAFFPVSNLSAPLAAVARVTPLWHAVDLTRMLVVGRVDISMLLVHVAYLGLLAVVGWWAAVRLLERRLIA